MFQDEEVIGSREAAELRRVTQQTINRWVIEGRLVPVYEMPGIRGARVFRKSDVLAQKVGTRGRRSAAHDEQIDSAEEQQAS